MNKLFSFFIELVFWIAIFLSPTLISGAIAFIIYINNNNLYWLSIAIGILGVSGGVLFAERIRIKYGCSRYISRILATPDIWPDEYPEEIEKRKRPDKKEK